MKIKLQNIRELSEENISFEKFTSKKRKLNGKQNLNKLVSSDESGNMFTSSDLEELRARGDINGLISIIKTGKEASVYLGKNDDGFIAVKIYTDLRVRSFRKDTLYRQGRFEGNMRIRKAIDQGSEFGLDAHQILWVNEEYRQMKFLYDYGIPVPKPIANSGLVILMQLIGTEDNAAERLSDLDLDKNEAEEAFNQSIEILKSLTASGRVHGDYSAYNILWHEGKAIVIDFPQLTEIRSNPHAKNLLRRDVASVCKSFKKYKLKTDEEKIYGNLLRTAVNNGHVF